MSKFRDLVKEIKDAIFDPLPKNFVHDDGFDDYLHNIPAQNSLLQKYVELQEFKPLVFKDTLLDIVPFIRKYFINKTIFIEKINEYGAPIKYCGCSLLRDIDFSEVDAHSTIFINYESIVGFELKPNGKSTAVYVNKAGNFIIDCNLGQYLFILKK